jgi:MarR family transcriptional regulator, organic hydroperoxide resistance regulator
MLKRMEKAGLLVRRADPNDLRVSRVYLTDKGRKLESQVEEVIRIMDHECFDEFTAEEKVLLRRFFIHMRSNLLNSLKS